MVSPNSYETTAGWNLRQLSYIGSGIEEMFEDGKQKELCRYGQVSGKATTKVKFKKHWLSIAFLHIWNICRLSFYGHCDVVEAINYALFHCQW